MIFEFDYENRYVKPMMIVCNPDLEELEVISFSQGLNITPAFNAVSKVTFSIPEKYTDNTSEDLIDTPSYDLLVKNRVIHIIGFGYFVIIQVEEYMNGSISTKSVTAYSYEYTLNKKYANLLDGTYKFYDELDNNTLLGKIIALVPSWTIGHIDSALWNTYRTFDSVDGDKTIYNFLMTDVEEAYGCIFDFDIENKTINAYTPDNIVSETDIVLKFDSTIKDITISEDDSSIKTALAVFGSGDLSINNVNPLGTSYIYNFDYYKNTNWMKQDLIDVLNIWEQKIESSKTEYSQILVNLKNKNAELIVLKDDLVDLQNELKALEQTRTVQYPDVLSSTTTAINNKNAEIVSKNTEIANKNNEITIISNQLKAINTALSFANNFTEDQLKQLDDFIDEDSYTNDNYEVTDSMSNLDIMELTEQLYDAGQKQLNIISQPNYTFNMNATNFLFIKEFQNYIDQIKLGCKIYVETDKMWYSPILLEMTLDYDNPSNFSMTFGNRFRICDDVWTVRELMGDVKSTSSSVKSNSSLWTKGGETADAVNEYMTSNLNAANQEIINSTAQTVTIGDYGLRCRELLSDGTYSPEQLWINKGLICMTDNNWQTSKLAIGKINGVYSVNAEVIAGNLIAGNQLKIASEDSSFIIDSNGTVIKNADITMISSNNRSKMLLSPSSGIRIQTSNDGFSWTDKFYVDTVTNKLIFKGDIQANSGNFGGWNITSNGISDTHGNYINSDGTLRVGILTINGSSGSFDGDIYADNLDDYGIKSRKIDSRAVTTSKIDDDAVTPSKLDRVYAEYGEFRSLKSDVAHVEDLVATKASITSLNAVNAKVNNLQANMITTDYLESNVIYVRGISGSFYPNFISWDGRTVKTIRFEDADGDTHAVLGLY